MPKQQLTILSPQTITAQGVTFPSTQWPTSLEAFKVSLLDASFTNPADIVELVTEFSWDNGVTWPYHDVNQWAGGSKARDGSSPSVALGPFMQNNALHNPTHGRGTLRAIAGTPVVGLALTILV